MKLKFSDQDIQDYIRFGMEIWLCIKEQYPKMIRNEETITICL